VEAALRQVGGLAVTRERGRLGELRVTVDGADVVRSNPLLYPTPSSVVRRVLTHMQRPSDSGPDTEG
jgi:hypothetical protein